MLLHRGTPPRYCCISGVIGGRWRSGARTYRYQVGEQTRVLLIVIATIPAAIMVLLKIVRGCQHTVGRRDFPGGERILLLGGEKLRAHGHRPLARSP